MTSNARIEVQESTKLAGAMAVAIRKVLLNLSSSRRRADKVRRALGILQAFKIRWPEGVELTLDVEAVVGAADSGNLGDDLGALLTETGEAAKAAGKAVLLTIDEMQYLKEEELEPLVRGLHQVEKRSYHCGGRRASIASGKPRRSQELR